MRNAAGWRTAKKPQIQIEIWSDYVCPFCYLEEPVISRISEEFRDQINIDWRAFELRPEPAPLLDPDGEYLHAIWNRAVYPLAHLRGMRLRLPPAQSRSRQAFEAVEFARAKGRFAEMHDALFRAYFQEGRDLSSLAVLLQVATSIGLDTEALRSALETARYAAKVIEDEKRAHDIGITGVPTMVMSRPGDLFEIQSLVAGAQPYELVQAVIERLLCGSE